MLSFNFCCQAWFLLISWVRESGLQVHAGSFLEQWLVIEPLRFWVVSFRGLMKLKQRAHQSPLGIKFIFSDKHPLRFHMGVPHLGFQMPNGKWRSERVKEWRSEGVKVWRSEGVKEWRSEGVKEWRSEGVKEWRSEGGKVSEGVKEWRSGVKSFHHYNLKNNIFQV